MYSPLKIAAFALMTMLSFGASVVRGQVIIADNFDIAGSGTGFGLNAGINSGINPPSTRLTGTAAANLRYLNTGTKAETAYSITSNKLRVAAAANAGRFTYSANGSTPFNFASDLGASTATPQNPAIYDVTISIANSSSGSFRCSFALAEAEGDATTWDFGIQIFRTAASDNFYTIGKRIDTTASGLASDLNTYITNTALGTYGTEIALLMRVTDAGSETTTFNSRIQISLDGGFSWIYDTATDADLPNGWRLNGAGRYFIWDVAPDAGVVTYDNFSVRPVPVKATLAFPANNATGLGASPNLRATVTNTLPGDLTVTFYGRQPPVPGPGPDFCIPVLPDTQNYAREASGSGNATKEMWIAQTEWIVTNRVSQNIAYVATLGDCVQNADVHSEWRNATNAMYRLESKPRTLLHDGVPYGITVGNHDQEPAGDEEGSTAYYNQYFGTDHFVDKAYYGGHYHTNNDNWYQLFSAGGMDFLVFSFEYGRYGSIILDWANDIAAAHPTRRIIVLTHHAGSDYHPSTLSNQGEAIYEAMKANTNFFLMLGGHVFNGSGEGEGRRTNTFNGNKVYTLISDYQGRFNGGDGLMRLMYFSPSNNLITIKTYSPYTDTFETDFNSQFTLSYNMQPNGAGSAGTPWVAIRTNTGVVSGAQTTSAWPNLQANKTYEWYVKVTDEQGNSVFSTTRQFKTGANTTPVATPQSLTVYGDLPTQLTLLGTDANSDVLSFITNSKPPNGILTNFNSVTGTVTYRPNTGYRGSDSFTYRVSDSVATSANATFTLNVIAPPPPRTTLTFEALPAGQLSNSGSQILQSFGDNAAESSPGVLVTGLGTPNIGLSWASSPGVWVYFNDSVWKAAQLHESEIGHTHDLIFSPTNGVAAKVNSFNFHGYYNSSERFTYQWQILSGAVVRTNGTFSFVSSGTKNHAVNINFTGYNEEELTLRLTRVASTLGGGEVEGDKANIAVDDIDFAEADGGPAPWDSPTILSHPQSVLVHQGSNATFSVTADGIELFYQWYFAAQPISGATNSILYIPNAQPTNVGAYYVSVYNVGGATNSSAANLSIIPDSLRPTVSVTTPGKNKGYAQDSVNISGFAKDSGAGNSGIIQFVKYSLNNGATNDANIFNLGSGTWSFSSPSPVALTPGTNSLVVWAGDLAGNQTNITVPFFYDLTNTLTLHIANKGKVKMGLTTWSGPTTLITNTFKVGRPYKIDAFVDKGTNCIFTNWITAPVDVGTSTNVWVQKSSLSFLMQPDMVITANFVTNPFTAALGTYNGLFHDTNNGVSHETAGYIQVKVKDKSVYSGLLYFDGNKISFSGKFTTAGTTTRDVLRTKVPGNKPPVSLSLSVDLIGGESLTGTLSATNGSWISQIMADKGVFNDKSLPYVLNTNYAGNYTMHIPPGIDAPTNSPGGIGYGMISNSLGGIVKLSGALGDGAKITQSMNVSRDGQWPLYAGLYKNLAGELKGSFMGWITFTTNADFGPSSNNVVTWTKKNGSESLVRYPNGFTNSVELAGSPYVAPGLLDVPIQLNAGKVVLAGGNLSTPATNLIYTVTDKKVTLAPSTTAGTLNNMTITFTKKNGYFTGNFLNPTVKSNFYGVLLQNQTNASGYFLGPNQSGSVKMTK